MAKKEPTMDIRLIICVDFSGCKDLRDARWIAEQKGIEALGEEL